MQYRRFRMIPLERIYGTFYKYRAFGEPDSHQRRRLRATIVDRVLYFAPPSKLNDPFDCYPYFTTSVPRTTTGEFFKHIDKHLGVYCMSRSYDSASQWENYAASHTGLCLEFTIRAGSSIHVYPVTYQPSRVEINIRSLRQGTRDDATREFFIAVTTKSDAWEKEAEVRILHRPNGEFEYPSDLNLTGVIFGARTSQKDSDWTRQQLEAARLTIPLARMEPDARHYLLNRVPL